MSSVKLVELLLFALAALLFVLDSLFVLAMPLLLFDSYLRLFDDDDVDA